MNLLLDTCTLLWLDGDASKLSPIALQAIEEPTNNLFLSSVSAWEVLQKHSNGKLELWGTCAEFLDGLAQDYGLEPLPFFAEDALVRSSLTLLHKDPFDLMLICQAQANNLTLVTPDPAIRQYPIPVLW